MEGRQHYNVTLAALTLAGTAFALQQTMVVPALPVIQRELGATTAWATWLLTVFLLTASVATPIFGKLGDQYGKERFLAISLGLFLAGSIGCALAWDIWSLIGFRALAGTGAAVFPLSFAIIRDEFPPEKIGVAIGIVSSVFGVGGGFGIVLSGVLVDNYSWRWMFVVGSIGIALAILLVIRFVPESPIKSPSRVDVPGAVLFSAGLLAFLIALTEGASWGWTSPRILGLVAGSALLLALWGWVETRVTDPMVDMRMLARRPVLVTNVVGLISGFAMFGLFVLIPNFVEMPRGLPPELASRVDYGFGASATKAGLYLLPGSIVLLFAAPVAGLVGRRVGFKWPMAVGMLLASCAAAMLALWHDEPWQVVASQPVMGLGVGAAFAAMAIVVTQSVRPTETGVATGMNTVTRTVGGVIGGQVGAALLSAYTIPGTDVPSITGFQIAFVASAVAALVGAVVALFVTRPIWRMRPLALEPG